MSLLTILDDWWAREAAALVVHDVPASAVQPAGDTGTVCRAGVDYFRIWLAEMRLARDREWFATRHPAVHVLVRLRFGDADEEFPIVAGPMSLPGLDQAHLGDVVQLDHLLTPLLPHNGGVVEIAAGLLALEGTSAVKEVVRAVETMGAVLAAPPLSTAVAAAGALGSALQVLLGAAAGRQHLGVHLSYAGAQAPKALHAGYVAILRQGASALEARDLSVQQGRLHLRGAPVTGLDYMLLRIERVEERDDWRALSAIDAPFREAQAALAYGNEAMAKAFMSRALLEALHSKDLTETDRRRVSSELRKAWDDSRNQGLGLERSSSSLADAMALAVPVSRFVHTAAASAEALLSLD
ncbi:hypothetical protein TBR22_A51520 [Luteitalea sp. TBR-22]|uniref:hypothetical protein n=1 Tax=Luteitalea sp. TBR-22 TaxID=2802971 RepID=UPI001AF96C71|nr:hypothetical protein [Luteitalea sp. TBR-22]BCS35917.1 hypothetical protein TBR22_A51520 [Luteitalea sp. TBR-22]